jgi:hypothetical protein
MSVGRVVVALSLASLLLTSCFVGRFRTRYINLKPQLQAEPRTAPLLTTAPPPSWRDFFVYGWAPSELLIKASEECGGIEHLERIETQQSFVQSLVESLAKYYVNIYSPYTAAVICDNAQE